MPQRRITDESSSIIQLLPPEIAQTLSAADSSEKLVELVLDLGRVPVARFVDRELALSNRELEQANIDQVVGNVGAFDSDNRAGIEKTLHRISAIPSKTGEVLGLTCRVGRAVYGVATIIEDLVHSGQSILVLGRPGSGKTTLLRDIARLLAENKRVVVIDTSNEIGGDGKIPHPAIGRARRMQVPTPTKQDEVMIEAVENHNRQAIVIDEIGRELEVEASRTIAERGVQLVGTAHGITLENILKNPVLCDLVGGVECVMLGDEEAARRSTQKAVLERRTEPTFGVLVEIEDFNGVYVYYNVADAVDAHLKGKPLSPEHRYWNAMDEVVKERGRFTPQDDERPNGRKRNRNDERRSGWGGSDGREQAGGYNRRQGAGGRAEVRLFAHGISKRVLTRAIRSTRVLFRVIDSVGEADVMLTIRSAMQQNEPSVAEAKRKGVSVHVVSGGDQAQVEAALVNLMSLGFE